MCGIVGYVGRRSCQGLLLSALEKLEYRGYDSAGVSVLTRGRLERVRTVGNLAHLRSAVESMPGRRSKVLEQATVGVGHTRWATHGGPSVDNAHPHADMDGRVHVVLNGIVENYIELRKDLRQEGVKFSSETDAEVVAHLVARHQRSDGSLVQAVLRAHRELRGHYAFVVVCADTPDLLVGARRECPLVVGVGDGEHFLSSAVGAFASETRQVMLVDDGEVVAVNSDGATFFDTAGARLERDVREVEASEQGPRRRGFESFMLKEIHEQPEATARTIEGRLEGPALLDELALDRREIRKLQRIHIVACGTSYHAGLVGRYAIEEWANLPVQFEIASEFRYGAPAVGRGDLVIGITQSGETADTLAAMRLARMRGAKVLAVTNVPDSQATRDADGVLLTRAGMEIGVAATKTFTCQVASLYVLALALAGARGALPSARRDALIHDLASLPSLLERLLCSSDGMRETAERLSEASFFMYIGRRTGLPVALEGALKLKEISYIPCDAYAAGEMKHGPIALLCEDTPVMCVATDSPVLDKLLSNIAEVKARGARVTAIATEGSKQMAEHADDIVYVPRTDWMLQPALAVVPLQLLAYHIARARGLNVDQPRNLAKTVTVE